MNTFQASLRGCANENAHSAEVVQRLKRFWSIEKKLREKPTMRLSQMQDVAGLRVVVPDVATLKKVNTAFQQKKFRHRLVGTDDYLEEPRSSGYRSVHLKYAYDNPRAPAYKGLRVEVQIRTQLQHVWAMAVETIGHNIKSDLKGGAGPTNWLDFFRHVAAAFAEREGLHHEGEFRVMRQAEIVSKTMKLADALGVESKLKALKMAVNAVNQVGMQGIRDFQLVELNLDERSVTIRAYSKSRIEQANEDYAALEKRQRDGENVAGVLVSAQSIRTLKSAYSSFFLNSDAFVEELRKFRRELAG